MTMHFCFVVIDFYPKLNLHPNATWKKNATTWADQKTVIRSPSRTIFIDAHDHVYTADSGAGKIFVWNRWQQLIRILNVSLYSHTDMFVGLNGDIFFQLHNENTAVYKWSSFSNQTAQVANFPYGCRALFVDLSNSLYCTHYLQHKVMKISLRQADFRELAVVVSDQLYYPWGAFIDRTFSLYVANAHDCRIQKFPRETSSGYVIAGNGIPAGLYFNMATDVMVDGSEILYVADARKHCIVRVKKDAASCIAGRSDVSAPTPDSLSAPLALQFDSKHNLYVADEFNSRIQKFELEDNHCSTLDFVLSQRLTPFCVLLRR